MTRIHHPAKDELELPAVLHALSDPHRLQVVRVLATCDSPQRCGAFGLSVTKSTATHHFRVLREAGVITQAEDGTARLNGLRRDDLDERFPGLLDAVLAASEPAGAVLTNAVAPALDARDDPAAPAV